MSPLRHPPSVGHKWLDRYEHGGPDRLPDRSRSLRWHHNQTPAAMEERISVLPAPYSCWGPATSSG